jgi:hypothetical protein
MSAASDAQAWYCCGKPRLGSRCPHCHKGSPWNPRKTLVLRWPGDLHEALRVASGRHEVSMNQLAIELLAGALDSLVPERSPCHA